MNEIDSYKSGVFSGEYVSSDKKINKCKKEIIQRLEKILN